MQALLYANTEIDDYTGQLPDILATGSSMDDLAMVESFSDSLSSLMGEKWNHCKFHIWNGDGSSRTADGSEISFAEVVEAFCSGDCHELSVDVPNGSTPGYRTENWSVRDIPGMARAHLVKTAKTPAGTMETPVIVASGTESDCSQAMEKVKDESCEFFDGGNGHWEYMDSDGGFVCYDIVEE